ncbi:YtxH domain-containing protein [Pedobacter aquatilis]|uniref:YtxH domain-containing protein n=1 Tax=Pedobacter aquatilis TaxID=351343 RepID=UPI0025B3E3E5|nr:YtxH domain-containing protein [Pedobacter aquatilis]MDN3587081.1 YtxH domain-containing protein [Pedobacter aquatilis]
MSLLKYVILGAAAVYGYNYATKKRVVDGKSIIDDLKDQAPDYIERAKRFGDKVKQDLNQTNGLY